VTVERLPLTANGKVDYGALPRGEAEREAGGREYVAPRTGTEELLANIWADLLGVPQVGVEDDFFDLGGHSLLATQVITRVRSLFNLDLPLQHLFESSKLGALAAVVDTALREARAVETPPILPVSRRDGLPLSFAQQRLWFLDQLEKGGTAYNIPLAVRLSGALRVEVLERTLSEVVRRHEVLRTTFEQVDGRPVQVVHEHEPLRLEVEDLRAPGREGAEAEAERLTAEEARTPFDLSAGPLLRARLLRLAEEEHVLAVTMHHIVSDGWSMGVLVKEVAALYVAYESGEESPLPELAVQYADYAAWQREHLAGETLERQLAYWRGRLGGLPTLELPTDFPRPAVQTYRGAQHLFTLPVGLARALKEFSRKQNATLFMTLLAAWQVLLSRYAGQEDVVVGADIANRNRPEVEGLVGFFVNQLVMRTNLSGNPTFVEALGRVREMALEAYTHQDVPFDRLVEELHPERDASRAPLFQVKFVLQNAPAGALELPGLTLSARGGESDTAKLDLMLMLSEGEDGLSGTLEYNTDLFAPETVARMRGHYEVLLGDIVARPETRLSKLELLTDEEKQRQAAERSEQDEAGLKRLKSSRRRSVRLPAPRPGEEPAPPQTPNDARDFPTHPDS
jgi:hypothetical protein